MAIELVIVGGLTGDILFSCRVDRDTSVDQIKADISKCLGHKPSRQRLIVGSTVLRSGRSLKEAVDLSPGNSSFQVLLFLRSHEKSNSLDSYLDKEWLENADVEEAELALRQHGGHLLYHMPGHLQADAETVLFALRIPASKHSMLLSCIAVTLWSSRRFVLAAIHQTPAFSKRLRADCRHYPFIEEWEEPSTSVLGYWQFFPAELRSDREVVRALLAHSRKEELLSTCLCTQTCKDALRDVAKLWNSDRDIMLAAVNLFGAVLQHASDELRCDSKVVLDSVRATQCEGFEALQFANETLRASREIVKAAVENRAASLQYASRALRADRDIVKAAVQRSADALQYASHALRVDRSFLLSVLEHNTHVLRFVPPALWKDCDFVLDAIVVQPAAADFVRASEETLIEAMDRNPSVAYAFSHCSRSGQIKQAMAEAHVWNRDRFDCHNQLHMQGVGSREWQQCDGTKTQTLGYCWTETVLTEPAWELEEIFFHEELLLEKKCERYRRLRQPLTKPCKANCLRMAL